MNVGTQTKNKQKERFIDIIIFSLKKGWQVLPLTFWYYSGFGTKLNLFFGFAKSFKYKTIFQLSQLPKSVVVAVTGSLFSIQLLF
ncbi:MAG: hypothetical protein C0430_04580 [Flavobacterium sp.]|nr:hypothetical protein [Flavobacterium sp.]